MAPGLSPRVHNFVSYSTTLVVFHFALRHWLGKPLDSISIDLGKQQLQIALLWSLHFARRTLESAFLHDYSKSRIDPADTAQEFLYYWVFATWIAYDAVYSPPTIYWLQALGACMFSIFELCNLKCHLMLKDMRSCTPGSYSMPKVEYLSSHISTLTPFCCLLLLNQGFLFDIVSCPHYLCEIMAWVSFSLAVQAWGAVVFCAVGAAIMSGYALERHEKYRKTFDDYPVDRRAIFPFVL
jgi:very-long-chain enoyl-CoA reductase